ncbi:MAG TPA: hypothetical protein VGM02_09085 [Acidobacteriaceae bacterium]|jgi:hypothetical protein
MRLISTRAKTALAAILFAISPALSPGLACASTPSSVAAAHIDRLIIRLINAETGEPMSHQNILVEWDADAEESLVYVGGKGRGTVELLAGSANLTMRPGTKDYGDPNRLAFFSCSGPTIAVPVEQAIRAGFVAHNECNGRTAQASPGEIVFWARPLPLWKPDFQ